VHDSWISRARTAWNRGQNSAARSYARTACVVDPAVAGIYRILHEFDGPNASFIHAYMAFLIDPRDEKAASRYAGAAIRGGRSVLGLLFLEKVVEAFPESLDARKMFHATQGILGDIEAAADGLCNLFFAHPRNRELFILSAQTAGRLGDFVLFDKVWRTAREHSSLAQCEKYAGAIRRGQRWMTGGVANEATAMQVHLSRITETEDTLLVVFVRHPIDLDHQAPIISRWVGSPGKYCSILLLEPIEEMRSRVGRSLLASISSLPGVCVAMLRDVVAMLDQRNAFQGIIRLFGGSRRRTVYVSDGADSWFMAQIREASEQVGQHLIALPHGENAITNRLQRIDGLTYPTEKVVDDPFYSERIFSNALALEAHALTEAASITKPREVLGSARYCDEWVRRLGDILPRDVVEASGKLLIGVFLIRERYNIWVDEIRRTLEMILAVPNVHLVVQKHPRVQTDVDLDTLDLIHREPSERYRWLDSIRPGTESSKITMVAPGTPGGAVVRAVDVCLTFGTSLSLDTVRLGKPCLELSYLHANRTLMQRFVPESDMRCRDDVLDWVRHFAGAEDKALLGRDFYDDPARVSFLKQFVDAGVPDVLGGYVKFLDRKAAEPCQIEKQG
jgi:hypothetical protein